MRHNPNYYDVFGRPAIFGDFKKVIDAIDTAVSSKDLFDNKNYPPFNIISTKDNKVIIEIAVAGFGKEDDISVEKEKTKLVVTGEKKLKEKIDDDNCTSNDSIGSFIYKGIANRSFKKDFYIAEYAEIESVVLENGILRIVIFENIPEADKPKKYPIGYVKK